MGPCSVYEGKVRRAFTLVELIVVVTVLAVLAAILFPVFARAKSAAKQTQCVSQLRQIGASIGLYTSDSDGIFPHAIDPIDRASPEIWSEFPEFQARIPYMPYLHDVLQPYVKSREVFHCPSDDGTAAMDDSPDVEFATTPSMHKVYDTSYFFRTEIAFRYFSDTRFRLPAETNVLFDAAGHWHGTGGKVAHNEFGPDWVRKVRGFRYTTLFGDLHVKNVSYGQLRDAWNVELE